MRVWGCRFYASDTIMDLEHACFVIQEWTVERREGKVRMRTPRARHIINVSRLDVLYGFIDWYIETRRIRVVFVAS